MSEFERSNDVSLEGPVVNKATKSGSKFRGVLACVITLASFSVPMVAVDADPVAAQTQDEIDEDDSFNAKADALADEVCDENTLRNRDKGEISEWLDYFLVDAPECLEANIGKWGFNFGDFLLPNFGSGGSDEPKTPMGDLHTCRVEVNRDTLVVGDEDHNDSNNYHVATTIITDALIDDVVAIESRAETTVPDSILPMIVYQRSGWNPGNGPRENEAGQSYSTTEGYAIEEFQREDGRSFRRIVFEGRVEFDDGSYTDCQPAILGVERAVLPSASTPWNNYYIEDPSPATGTIPQAETESPLTETPQVDTPEQSGCSIVYTADNTWRIIVIDPELVGQRQSWRQGGERASEHYTIGSELEELSKLPPGRYFAVISDGKSGFTSDDTVCTGEVVIATGQSVVPPPQQPDIHPNGHPYCDNDLSNTPCMPQPGDGNVG